MSNIDKDLDNSAEEVVDDTIDNAEEVLEEVVEETDPLSEMADKLAETKDKYLRLMAEYDNYRKRTEKEKVETFGNATIRCVSEVLPVLDNFKRALDSNCSDDSYKNGITMIYNMLCEFLKKQGVTEIEALNQPFDPNLHNAIKQVSDDELEDGTVCEVFQVGYKLGDKVIRHAMVAVVG